MTAKHSDNDKRSARENAAFVLGSAAVVAAAAAMALAGEGLTVLVNEPLELIGKVARSVGVRLGRA